MSGAAVVAETSTGALAVFGGSFNPPHLGHEDILRTLLERDLAGQVLVVPVFAHPFGKALAPFPDRLAMARLGFAALGPRVVVSDIERELGGPSYTVRTLEEIRRRWPGTALGLVVGADALDDTAHWKDFTRVRELASLLVVPRRGEPSQGTLDVPAPRAVSSTEVRRRIAHGETTAGLLAPPVADYIRAHNLYREGPAGPGSSGDGP